MRDLLRKEMKLSASPLSFFFILFGFMFFLPGYPILCAVFFVTLGIYQSFQNARETNDILFSALLPIAKQDVVRGKYLFVCLIELTSLCLMGLITAVRMTLLSEAAVYRNNALMNANPFALGLAFFMFGLFNVIFLGGFFKTAYKIGRPFLAYIAGAFMTVVVGETLHHLPGLSRLNAFGTESIGLQLALLAGGIALYVLLSLVSCKMACDRFERIDL